MCSCSTMPSEESDSVRRPVGEERLADDPRLRDRPPEAAVLGVGAIVAHHEVVAARNRDRGGEVARAAAIARNGVGVLLRHTVAGHVTAVDRPTVPGTADPAPDASPR